MEHKEEINIQPEQNEEIRIQKNEGSLGTSGITLNIPTSGIIGVPEGLEEEQDIENLFEKIMMDNFFSLAKEIDFQEVREAQRVPKKLDPRKHKPRHIIITLPKMKER